MFTPKPLNKKYTLCGYTFDIYDITGFDFKEQIDLPSAKGLYCFTSENGCKVIKPSEDNKTQRFAFIHELYYIGMTSDFSKRFDQHEKQDKLVNIMPLRIGIYFCSNNENEKVIESLILDNYAIQENIAENEAAKKLKLPSVITED